MAGASRHLPRHGIRFDDNESIWSSAVHWRWRCWRGSLLGCGDAHTYCHGNGDCDSYSNGHSHQHSNGDAYSYFDGTDAYGNRDADCNSDCHADCDEYCECYPYRDRDCYAYRDKHPRCLWLSQKRRSILSLNL